MSSSSSRRYIITNHIYPGAKFDEKSKDLLHSKYNDQIFSLLYQYRDRIVIEVSAHDHFADIRYHSDSASSDKQFYHNLLVSPGISPLKNQNPGVAIFEIDAHTFTPQNLKMIFLDLPQTYQISDLTTSNLPFRSMLFSDYGLYSLTPKALSDFKSKLDANDQLTYNYLVAKLGYDPNKNSEYAEGMKILTNEIDILTSSKEKIYKYICQMHMSKTSDEIDQCISSQKALALSSTAEFLK